jgi:cell fate regulator YaaT (PSP1 superfamily)
MEKKYTQNTCGCQMNIKGCRKNSSNKLATFDWLCDLPETQEDTDFVEVQFKNTRKGYFLNSTKIPLEKGDMIAVEASPGHDIGEVSLTGRLVLFQMKKNNINPEKIEVRRVYRKAKPADIEKYEEAKGKEQETMIKARKIAEDLQLNMKIGDVEYQGDGNKAIFYYIADERVDFRQLIRVLADTFHVRIEMRQIGTRQEAGRIGGIGPCGRELCCATWMTNFVSVATSSARYQDISLNPQKLAGQCAKLKCCMNYELDAYVDAQKDFPSKEIPLETKDATWYHFKTDVFKRQMAYSSSPTFAANVTTLSVDRVKHIIALNKKGERVDNLAEKENEKTPSVGFQNAVGQDSLTRFDSKKKKKFKPKFTTDNEHKKPFLKKNNTNSSQND